MEQVWPGLQRIRHNPPHELRRLSQHTRVGNGRPSPAAPWNSFATRTQYLAASPRKRRCRGCSSARRVRHLHP